MARLILIFLLSSLLAAQTPPALFDPHNDPALIEQGLQSTIPLQVAISASRAVSITDRRRAEWLRDALKRSASLQPESEALRARRVIFDALIRTHTPVPLSDVLPFYDQFPAAVIALVARNNRGQSEDRLPLLRKTEEAKNATFWFAAASLVDRKQLAHYLLQQAHFDYAISVVDQDFLPVQISGGFPSPFGVPAGVPVGPPPPGPPGSPPTWPAETIYHIEMFGDIDHLLTCCIGGQTYLEEWSPASSALRRVQQADPQAWQDHDRDIVRGLLSIAYCPFCSLPNRVDFPTIRGSKATIVWRSPEQAIPLLEQAVETYVKECLKLVDTLHETSFSESELRAKVRIWLRDNRRVKTIPIPSVGAGVEFNRCAPAQGESRNGRCID